MKQILRYLKPYLGKLLAATVLIALSTLCDLLLPTWMSAILNGGIAARDFPAIAVRCLQMLAIAAVSLASILGGTRLSTEVVACFCADLRADVFRKVNTLSFEEFGSLGTAALVTRATHDVDTVSWVASMLSGTVATIPMLFLGGVVLAMRKDVVLSLVLLAFVPLLTLIVVLLGKRVLPLWGKSDDYIDMQNALLRERLRGIRVIRAFNTEKREHGRIADATHIMAENIIRANVSMGLLTPLATLFLNISALLIIYLGGWRMVHGVSGVSAGDIFAIIQYVTMVMNGVIMASFAIIMYPRAQVAAGRIHQVLGAEGMGDPMAGETAELHGEIELQDVSFSYGGSADAISHVSLHILPGQRISVIGGTGSGKSTLMHLLLGFRAPTQGRILFDGRDAAGLSKHTLRRGISSVLQGAAIYSGTIGENIRMGDPDADDAAVRVGRVLMADHEAVRERGHLKVVADTRHRAALRNDVTEMVEQRENLLLRERVRVFLLDAFDFGSDALVHLARRFLVDVSERVLEGVLADPHRGGEVVPVEILLRLGNRIVVIDLLRRVGFGGF